MYKYTKEALEKILYYLSIPHELNMERRCGSGERVDIAPFDEKSNRFIGLIPYELYNDMLVEISNEYNADKGMQERVANRLRERYQKLYDAYGGGNG